MYLKNRDVHDYQNDEAYEKLGNAIVLQAVKDYRAACKSLRSSPGNIVAKTTVREVERFFHSELFSVITELDPDMLLIKLKQEAVEL